MGVDDLIMVEDADGGRGDARDVANLADDGSRPSKTVEDSRQSHGANGGDGLRLDSGHGDRIAPPGSGRSELRWIN